MRAFSLFQVSVLRGSVATVAALFALGGCSSSSSPSDGSSSIEVGQQTLTLQTGTNGQVQFNFTVPAQTTSLQLVGASGESVLIPQALAHEGGSALLPNSSESTDQARANSSSPSTLNVPFLEGAVPSGTYSAQYQLSSFAAGVDSRFSILTKSDSDGLNGTLRLNLINVGPTANSEALREDLEGVLNIVKTIFSRAGISIDPQWYDFDGSERLPDPREGSALYQTISAAVRPLSVNVIFAARVDDLSSDDRYGVAGAAPGPSVPSPRSVVVIDLLEVTGGDGEFQTDDDDKDDRPSGHNDEVRLAAEEVVRTVSNYLGLENTVTFSGSRVTDSDTLSDTDSCLTEESCEGYESTRSNAMMPRPIRERDSSGRRRYWARDSFTEQQRRVLNNNVLVD